MTMNLVAPVKGARCVHCGNTGIAVQMGFCYRHMGVICNQRAKPACMTCHLDVAEKAMRLQSALTSRHYDQFAAH